jgi:hypothetical protein
MAGVGVSDESHFVRDFKKTCGLAPARYRERFLRGGGENGARPKAGGLTVAAPPRVVTPTMQAAAPPSSVPVANLLDVGGPLADIVALLNQILGLL